MRTPKKKTRPAHHSYCVCIDCEPFRIYPVDAPTFKIDGTGSARLKITSVSYGRTVNVGKFESVRLDATADVQTGQTPAEVLETLQAFIGEQEALAQRKYRP